MRYAIISDIHSNTEAMEAVIGRCVEERIDSFICLGDIVGYNANPSECLDLVRGLNVKYHIRGNHDQYAGDGAELIGFNKYAKKAIEWTREQLSDEQKKWLMKNKLKIVNLKENFTLVHGTLDSPASWGYIFDVHNASDNFSYQVTQLCFCGHSHIPVLFIKDPNSKNDHKITRFIPWEDVPFDENCEISVKVERNLKYLVNAGSIGQPRNGDPRSSFCTFDTRSRILKRICVEYDINATQKKIIDAGLPEQLADRLAKGY